MSSGWAVFWSGVGGVIVGAVIGAVTSFLIARYTLLRTRADGKQLAQAERNEDAARRITESLVDLQQALRTERLEQDGPLDRLAIVNREIESLVRVTKLDIPILVSEAMRRRVYSARRSAEATRDWLRRPLKDHERGLVTADELEQELLEILSKRPLFGIVATLISDLHVYRNSGQEPTQDLAVVSSPEPEGLRRLRRLQQQLEQASAVPAEPEPIRSGDEKPI